VTITLHLKPDVQSRVAAQAAASGLPVDAFVERIIEEFATATQIADPTLALFARWDAEDATDDPAEIAARNREWEDLEASLKAHRLWFREPVE